MKLNFKLALKFIIKSPLQSLLIVFTVFVGLGAQLFIINLSESLNNLVDEALLYGNEHIHVSRRSTEYPRGFVVTEEAKESILEDPRVEAVAYTSSTTRNFSKDNKTIEGEFLMFFLNDFDGFNFYDIEDQLIEGTIPTKTNQIVISQYFADAVNFKVGDYMYYEISATQTIKYEITGIFSVSELHFRSSFGYGLIKSYQSTQLMRASGLSIKLKNPEDDFDEFYEDFIKIYTVDEHYVYTYKTRYQTVSLISEAQTIVFVIIQLFISMIIFVVVASTMTYSVKKKYAEIGILKALGQTNTNIRRTFLLSTMMLAIIGVILGFFASKIGQIIYQYIMTYEDGRKRILIITNKPYNIAAIGLVLITVFASNYSAFKEIKHTSIIEVIRGN